MENGALKTTAFILLLFGVSLTAGASETFPFVDDLEADPFATGRWTIGGGIFSWTQSQSFSPTHALATPPGNLNFDESAWVQVFGVPTDNVGTLTIEWQSYIAAPRVGNNVIHLLAAVAGPFTLANQNRYDGVTAGVFADGQLRLYDNSAWHDLKDQSNNDVFPPVGQWIANRFEYDRAARSYVYTVTFGNTMGTYGSSNNAPHFIMGDSDTIFLAVNSFSPGDVLFTDDLRVTGAGLCNPVKTDLNNDCIVNLVDFAILTMSWLQPN